MKFDNMTQFGAPNLNERKSKITDGRHIEKTQYLTNGLPDLYEIWSDDPERVSYPLKI